VAMKERVLAALNEKHYAFMNQWVLGSGYLDYVALGIKVDLKLQGLFSSMKLTLIEACELSNYCIY
jgi:hypothetical protein